MQAAGFTVFGYHIRAIVESRQPPDEAYATAVAGLRTRRAARMVDQPLSVSDDPTMCGADKAAIIELMRTHPSFAHLPPSAVAGLIERSALAHFTAGELLIRQGDMSDAAFL